MVEITKDSITDSKLLTDTEKTVLLHMLKWEEWNKVHQRENEDTFILANESGLIEIDAYTLFTAIYHLVELGILKKRDCDAVAYEWDNKERLEEFL